MIERVLLVAWKGSAATGWIDTLKGGGYQVLLEDTTGERAWRTAKERGIDLVIIDGQKKPSHGRQTGHALRDTAKTREIPIIWTNLDAEDAASVQEDVRPDMLLPAPTDAAMALAAIHALQPGGVVGAVDDPGHDHAHDHAHEHAPELAVPADPPADAAPQPAPAAPAPPVAPAPAPPRRAAPRKPARKPARKTAAAGRKLAKRPAAARSSARKPPTKRKPDRRSR